MVQRLERARKLIGVGRLLGLLLLIALPGCGTLEAGIEHAPVQPMATATPQVVGTGAPSESLASPGKLAYVHEGDVWAKDLPDGQPARLTGDARSSGPRWSPSGQRLAVRHGEQVHLMAADGSSYPLDGGGPVGEYCWAPSRDVLAYVGSTGGLYTVEGDGSRQRMLVAQGEAGGRVDHIAWSPDGGWIAYEWRSGDAASNASVREGLWRVSAVTGARAEVYTADADERHVALWGWSPDGRQILFWQAFPPGQEPGAALCAVPAEGGTVQAFAPETASSWSIPLHGGAVAPSPRPAPGMGAGRLALAVSSAGQLWNTTRLALAGLDDSAPEMLTPEGQAAYWPAWSPDGLHLAYSEAPDVTGGAPTTSHIEALDLQPEERRRLTDDRAYRDERPLWSADGSRLLFVRWDGNGRASLWLVPAAGGAPEEVVDQLSLPSSPGQGDGYVDWGSLYDWWQGSPSTPDALGFR